MQSWRATIDARDKPRRIRPPVLQRNRLHSQKMSIVWKQLLGGTLPDDLWRGPLFTVLLHRKPSHKTTLLSCGVENPIHGLFRRARAHQDQALSDRGTLA